MRAAHQDRTAAGAHSLPPQSGDGPMQAEATEIVFWVSSAAGPTPERWSEWIRVHWRSENGSH